jgi:hypothetical protein
LKAATADPFGTGKKAAGDLLHAPDRGNGKPQCLHGRDVLGFRISWEDGTSTSALTTRSVRKWRTSLRSSHQAQISVAPV